MREHSRPNPLVAVFYAFFPLLVGAGVLFVLVIIGGKAVQGYEMRQEAKAMEQKVDQLRRENRDLAGQLDYYKSDQYIEKVAREELGLARPNDVPVIMVYPDGSQGPSVVPTPVPTPVPQRRQKETATWQRWLDIFVDRD